MMVLNKLNRWITRTASQQRIYLRELCGLTVRSPKHRVPESFSKESSRSLESGLDQDCQALGQCPMVMKELAMLQCRRSWLEGIRATSRDGPQFIGGRDHATRPSWYRHPGQRTI